MQNLWKHNIDWDEPIHEDINAEWIKYVSDLQEADQIIVPRKILSNCSHESSRIEMYGFSDASKKTYGACIYLRSFTSEGLPKVHLVCAKSRVTLLKVLSIPRLELCSAQLLAQLAAKVKKLLDIKINKKYYWTDSTIVLHWIRATNKKLPVFIAHRVGDIQDATAAKDWKHVGSKENPADLISRRASIKELATSRIWWNGPHWMYEKSYRKSNTIKSIAKHKTRNNTKQKS